MNEERVFKEAFCYKLIYIFRINDEAHRKALKIGDATLHTIKGIEEIVPNCEELNSSARERINNYTATAGITYELLHTELAVRNDGTAFRDYDVHSVLERSGIKKKFFNTIKKQNEWFEVDLNTAKNAIVAVKNNRKCLEGISVTVNQSPIVFRPEQIEAINKTTAAFKTKNKVLWNAKMRFGKTLCALQVAKNLKYCKTIIITHRPVVKEGWFEDFHKIFDESDKEYLYGSKDAGEDIGGLLKSKRKFVYFASLQDLRGSEAVGGNFKKNQEIFDIDWDLVVVDEAHEGTQTKLGKSVLEQVIKSKNPKHVTHVLDLSGTPFNLFDSFESDEIYTWDYIMEQRAKLNWRIEHYGDSNPYEELPALNIFTYELDRFIHGYVDEDKAFNFKEFFRTWTGEIEKDRKAIPGDSKIGEFVNKEDVKRLLSLLTDTSKDTNYPFSKPEYREIFKHSLWMVPGVKEAKALSEMLKQHEVFGSFGIVNVAGEGDDEGEYEATLAAVKQAIKDNDYTITISCGRLTTGVTVPEWTAVLMFAGSYSTSASSYLQTIFRVQSPCNEYGKIKEECYVFDFAPDRMLTMVSQAGQLSTKAGSIESKEIMGEFLNFCPIISVDGSKMTKYNVEAMLQQLKRGYAKKVVDNGFDHKNIYNDNLLKLDGIELEEFAKLKKIIGASKQTKKVEPIIVASQHFNNEEYEMVNSGQKKKKELTEEEIKRLEEFKKKRKEAQSAISILRGISIRIPLLIYGADIEFEEDITCDNLPDIVDDLSWDEFMPKGVTKELYSKFTKYYDQEIFILAGRKIRNTVKYADKLDPRERIKRISKLFSTFKNPDKETVLTPWKTVNSHMGDCIGGFNFNTGDDEPRYINKGEVTSDILNSSKEVKVLDINSKTGLYPLYITYSLYKQKLINYGKKDINDDMKEKIWDEVVEKNIYVLCKTQMAKYITNRTLCGYKKIHANIIAEEKITTELQCDMEATIKRITSLKEWNKGSGNMRFDAIVGNPPYQEIITKGENNASLGKQLFPTFVIAAIKMNPTYVSLITPSRWFAGDAQDRSFIKLREFIKENNHISCLYNYPSSREIFDNVIIKGGVNYFLFDKNYQGNVDFYTNIDGKRELQNRKLFEDGLDIVLANKMDYEILKKVQQKGESTLINLAKGRNAFGIVGKEEKIDEISSTKKLPNYIELRCKGNEIRYTDIKNVTKSKDVFEKYKVFISKSAGDPITDSKVIGQPYIGIPMTACTDSLIPIGKFSTLKEAENLKKYMLTKFMRFMVSIVKVSQNVYQNVYKFVPIQDFKTNEDINWEKSIDEIDSQLYKKYGLDEDEIAYINKKISPMD